MDSMEPWGPRVGYHGIPGLVAHGIQGGFPMGSQDGPLVPLGLGDLLGLGELRPWALGETSRYVPGR